MSYSTTTMVKEMTLSEQIFDSYLSNREIKFKVEQGHLVHPDRFLSLPQGLVICEIKQLESKINRARIVTSFFNPYKKLRNAIKKKVRQGKEAKKDNVPYVIVIFNYNSHQITSNEIVEAVMYGDITIVIDIPQDIKKRGKVRGNFFAGNGSLRYARDHQEPGVPIKKRISAIAILEIINPTDELLSLEYNKASKGISIQEIDKLFIILDEITEKLEKEGKYKKDLRIPRLRVFHNFYASNPLGFKVFNGKYDKQYYIDPATGQSRKY